MRILASLPRYPPRSLVGAFLSTHEFLRHMVERGHDVTVTTADGADGLVLDGVKVERSRRFSELVGPADVVVSHLHDGGSASWHAMCNGKPAVRMVHGGGEAEALERLGQWPTALAVFSSNAIADEVGWHGPSVVCRPPIDLEAHRTDEVGRHVTLVNLSELKGGRVFWRLAEALPDVAFLGVLGGWGEQVVERLADHPNVRVLPPTRHMASDVWARTGVLLMPSERETFGRVALEAGINGIPTVAYPCPGIAEALGHAATWVLPGASFVVDRWVAALEHLDDPNVYRIKSGQARDVAGHYRPDLELARFAGAVEALVPAGVPA